MTTLKIGDKAPQFEAKDNASSKTISASVFDGEGAGSLWKNMRAASASALSGPQKKLEPGPRVKAEYV